MTVRAAGDQVPRIRMALPASISTASVIDYGKRGSLFGSALGFLFFSILAGALVASLALPAALVASRGTTATVGFFNALPDYITIDQQSQRNVIFATRDTNLFLGTNDQRARRKQWRILRCHFCTGHIPRFAMASASEAPQHRAIVDVENDARIHFAGDGQRAMTGATCRFL